MFWKKKKPAQKLLLGLEMKRCVECRGPERPCLVEGKFCTFHRWMDEDSALLRINAYMSPNEQEKLHRRFKEMGLVPSCCSTEVLRTTFALIEYPDGSIGKVKPELVQFTDREH